MSGEKVERPTLEQVMDMSPSQVVEAMRAQNRSKQVLSDRLSRLIKAVALATGNEPDGFRFDDALEALE